MKVVIRRFSGRKNPCLTLEQGNQDIVLASFRNETTAKLFEEFLGGNNAIKNTDERTIDELMELVENSRCD